jgi:hypothetical protein
MRREMRRRALIAEPVVAHIRRVRKERRMETRKRWARKLGWMLAAALWGAGLQTCEAAQLKTETAEAFDKYIHQKEAQNESELKGGKDFLWIDTLPEVERAQLYAKLRLGQVLLRNNLEGKGVPALVVPKGMIHDWSGIVFIQGVSMAQALAILEDYDRAAEYYQPDVVKSKVLEHSGEEWRIYLRLKRVKVVTVEFDTEYDVHNTKVDAAHAVSQSYSTKIAELEHAGESKERERPVGDDHGFLWRLDSYWRIYEADGGVYVQCEAVSLTRDIPAGLSLVVKPFIKSIPSESLRRTLESTRKAMEANSPRESRPVDNAPAKSDEGD